MNPNPYAHSPYANGNAGMTPHGHGHGNGVAPTPTPAPTSTAVVKGDNLSNGGSGSNTRPATAEGAKRTDREKKTRPLGPLEPDHIREALRRYRKDGEGGGAGVEGRTVGMGLAGSVASRMGGKRLFR
jgi:hypothetical protein